MAPSNQDPELGSPTSEETCSIASRHVFADFLPSPFVPGQHSFFAFAFATCNPTCTRCLADSRSGH